MQTTKPKQKNPETEEIKAAIKDRDKVIKSKKIVNK